MEKAKFNKYGYKKSTFQFAVIIGLLAVVTACSHNYGGFALNAEVTQDFKTGVVRADLDYYYSGRDTMPYAIIGIEPGYSVPSRYWTAFDPQSQQLKNMSGNIYGKHRREPQGSFISGPGGDVIGIWFSNIMAQSVTVNQEAKIVEVLFPNPENDGPGIGGRRSG
jgi:hypothetical protein